MSEKFIGESPMKDKPTKKLVLNIASGAVKTKHIADKAVTKEKIAEDVVEVPGIADALNHLDRLQTQVDNIEETWTADIAAHNDDELAHNQRIKWTELAIESLRGALTELRDKFALYYTKEESYNRTVVDAKVAAVQSALDTLIGSGDVTHAIDTFNEIRDFLAGIEDTTLQEILQSLQESIDTAIASIQQADWNVNDSTSQAYVKNRTHYTESVENWETVANGSLQGPSRDDNNNPRYVLQSFFTSIRNAQVGDRIKITYCTVSPYPEPQVELMGLYEVQEIDPDAFTGSFTATAVEGSNDLSEGISGNLHSYPYYLVFTGATTAFSNNLTMYSNASIELLKTVETEIVHTLDEKYIPTISTEKLTGSIEVSMLTGSIPTTLLEGGIVDTGEQLTVARKEVDLISTGTGNKIEVVGSNIGLYGSINLSGSYINLSGSTCLSGDTVVSGTLTISGYNPVVFERGSIGGFCGSINLSGSLLADGSLETVGGLVKADKLLLLNNGSYNGSAENLRDQPEALKVEGSTTLWGSLTVSGNTYLSGSTVLSGSITLSGSNFLSGSTALYGNNLLTGTNILNGLNFLSGSTWLSGKLYASGGQIIDANIGVGAQLNATLGGTGKIPTSMLTGSISANMLSGSIYQATLSYCTLEGPTTVSGDLYLNGREIHGAFIVGPIITGGWAMLSTNLTGTGKIPTSMLSGSITASNVSGESAVSINGNTGTVHISGSTVNISGSTITLSGSAGTISIADLQGGLTAGYKMVGATGVGYVELTGTGAYVDTEVLRVSGIILSGSMTGTGFIPTSMLSGSIAGRALTGSISGDLVQLQVSTATEAGVAVEVLCRILKAATTNGGDIADAINTALSGYVSGTNPYIDMLL